MASEGKSLRNISRILQERNLSIPGQYLKTGHLYQEPGDEIKNWHVGVQSEIFSGIRLTLEIWFRAEESPGFGK